MFKNSVVFLFSLGMVSCQNLTADDEDFSTTGVLNNFLTHLESISGLSSLEPNSTITGINCPDISECTINPNGTILWEVRSELYRNHIMQNKSDEIEQQTTLDGCLVYNPTDSSSYNTCMRTVRTNMRVYLILSFTKKFISLIEEDCSLIQENCV